MSDALSCKPELLAPAGTLEAVGIVLQAGADAVYVGGKKHNMRQHCSSYNLDDLELHQAIELAHQTGKKLYVTLNSLTYESELSAIHSFLSWLRTLRPDGLIVQDLAVAALAREICVEIPLHASTMMNIHSIPAARVLKMMGFSRIIASNSVTLAEVQRIGEQVGIEMEYFVHGDLCVAQNSQCLLSGIMLGESSNRGCCLKPCRWSWQMQMPQADSNTTGSTSGYFLARKDMCLLDHIPELFQYKITSLKIEGRMRTAEFLGPLVKLYREAIDVYATDPQHYVLNPEHKQAIELRQVRDYCTGHAFARPEKDSVDLSGRREPRFFSYAAPKLTRPQIPEAPIAPIARKPELIAHVANVAAARSALQAGADAIYIGGDDFIPTLGDDPLVAIEQLLHDTEVRPFRMVLLSTRICDEQDLLTWNLQLDAVRHFRDLGIGVSNLSALAVARERHYRTIIADFSFNTSNSISVDELSTLGVMRVTAGLELNLEHLEQFLGASRLPVEVIVHGPLDTMLLEYCLIKAAVSDMPQQRCVDICSKGPAYLIDKTGNIYPVIADRRCRNHILSPGDLCLLPQLPRLLGFPVGGIRVEAQFYASETVGQVVETYRQALDAWNQGASYDVEQSLNHLERLTRRQLFSGALMISDPS